MFSVSRRGFLRTSGQGLIAARVVTNVAKPKEAMVWAETAIERLVTR